MESPILARLLELVSGSGLEGWWAWAVPAALVPAGWALASLCRRIAVRLLRRWLTRIEPRVAVRSSVRFREWLDSLPDPLGRIVFWIIFGLGVVTGVQTLPFAATDGLLEPVARFLPRFLLAIAILFAGILAARIAQHWVRALRGGPPDDRSEAMARLARWGILAVSVIVSAQQIGLQGAGFVSSLALVILGAGLGAIALAFGVGAGPVVTNLLASHYASRAFRVGDAVRMGEIRGEVSRITATSIVIEVNGDSVHVPARTFCEQASVVIGRQD